MHKVNSVNTLLIPVSNKTTSLLVNKEFLYICTFLETLLWNLNAPSFYPLCCFPIVGQIKKYLIPSHLRTHANKTSYVTYNESYSQYGLQWIQVVLLVGTSGFISNLRQFLWIKVQQFTSRGIQVPLRWLLILLPFTSLYTFSFGFVIGLRWSFL